MKKILIFSALAVLLIGLPLYSKYNRGSDAVKVEVEEASEKLIKSSILASGTLAFREQVQLRSEVIAQVTAVEVEEGDPVSKGDLLIALNTENVDAQLEQAEARVRIQAIAIEQQRLLVSNLERRHRDATELRDRNLVDNDSVENLGNELSMSRVQLRSLEESLSQARAARAQILDLLSKTRILSPIDGLVIQVDVKVGETVIAGTTNIPGSTIMVVADPSEMLVEVRVDEADIAQVREGQEADIFAAAFPDTPLRGTVESIATTARQTAGQQSLSFLVKILLDDQDELDVRSGMSARAEIFTQSSEQSLAVPLQAIQYDEDVDSEDTNAEEQTYVMLMIDGKAVRRDVEVGISSDSDQQVTAGLQAGDPVISGPFRALRNLDEGDPVELLDEDADDDSDDGEE